MREDNWIKHYWRPLIAYQYLLVCLFDFIFAPILNYLYYYTTNQPLVQWDPMTLKESAFYHVSMAAIIGVSAWTRGQEKIQKIFFGSTDNTTENKGN